MPSPGETEQSLTTTEAAAVDTAAAPAPADQAPPQNNTPSTDVAASSSDAGESRDTLLEVVKNAAKQATAPESPSRSDQAPPASAEPGTTETTTDPKTAKPEGEAEQDNLEEDPSEDELRGYKPKTRERIQRLLRQRDYYRDRATGFENVEAFMQQNNLTPIAAANALKAAAMIQAAQEGRLDPAVALKELDGYRTALLQLTGDALPPDVKQKLDDGLIDEDSARELARRRSAEQTLRTRAERADQSVQQEQARQQTAVMRGAVDKWATAKQASDPDFASVYPELETEILAAFARQGRPTTIAAATVLLEGAYSRAKAKLVGRQAPPQPSRQQQPSGSTTPTTAVVMDEKSLLALPLAQRIALAAQGKGLRTS